MSVPSYPFHSLPLKLPNKGMNLSFTPLKLSNKGNEEYSKNIPFILFHSIRFSPLKRSLKVHRLHKSYIQGVNCGKYLFTPTFPLLSRF